MHRCCDTQLIFPATKLHCSSVYNNTMLNIFGISELFPNWASASQKTTIPLKVSPQILPISFVRISSENSGNFLVVFLFSVCNKQPILSLLFLKLGVSGKIWALAASFARSTQLTRGISHLQEQHQRMLQLLKLNIWHGLWGSKWHLKFGPTLGSTSQ